jgi:two-component system, sensor histidine kinase and response regulator
MEAGTIRVLLVEDEPADVEFARRALSRTSHSKFELCCAADLTETFEHLRTGAFDVVVLDLGLPECTGLESLQNVRERNREIPIVVLTGLRDEKAALESLEQGAQDYLVKGHLTADTFDRSIRYAIQRQQAKDALARQARDLTRANADLEHVNRELKQFAYAASHDLKEPLRMVTSYCQLLDLEYRDRLDAEGCKYLHFANDGAKRMQRLIDDLLSFSSVGMTNDPLEPVDLREALEDALLNLEAAIQESLAKIETVSLPTVPGHRALLAVLFQNLIGNAIKFRGQRLPVIRVSCSAGEEGWDLAVADNGIGIEPEYHDRVFGLFQRLHTRDEYPGTGIGLATCKKIVERHGGRIWVASRPGRGTTMHFTLPRCAVPVALTAEAVLA